MTILDPEPRAMLSAITEIALIETGNRSAREHWQQIQLRNLVNNATQRSAFWRARIGSRKRPDIDLAALPILTRQDLRTQVASEGPLLRAADGFSTKPHATSGSSGVPVHFFISDFNTDYNLIRSLAQYFLEGRDTIPQPNTIYKCRCPCGRRHFRREARNVDRTARFGFEIRQKQRNQLLHPERRRLSRACSGIAAR